MGNSDRRKFGLSFRTMDTTLWVSLVGALIALATPVSSSQPRVVCYYTNWSVYRPGTARFNPQNINPYLCTHLIYAFGGFTKDNTLKPFDKYQDIEKGGYAKFNGLKTYNRQLKTLLAIGGWNEGSSRFSPMVASRDKRKEFVRNVIKFLRQNHFDGLDLDWEYPAFRDGGKPKDRENYSKLVKELREEFDRESAKTGKPRLLLTMAVPAGIEYIEKGFDVKTLNQYLDWMNLLTYDYHSAFEPAVNHHAPLYPLEQQNEYSVDNELNIDYTIKFYLEHGADRDKLVLGIPTYGRSYTLFNPDAAELGAPADGPGEQGEATREKGYLAYYEICESLKPKENKKRKTDDDDDDEEAEEEDKPWVVMHPYPKAMGPVAFRGNQWVGYDDMDIVRKKGEYVAEHELGGIMFWSIDNDDFRGTCHGKPYPLIEAAKEAYLGKLGSTDNSIVKDSSRSQSVVRNSSNRRNRPRTTSTTTERATTVEKESKRKNSVISTTPSWKIITPEPPTTPDPGSDFKCTDEGFFPHPRDCKKYFWCLDSGPSNLGIVAHAFTCPSGLFFNKAADSCDFARNVLCKKTAAASTKAPTTKTTEITTTTTTRKPVKLSTKSSLSFRSTTTSTTSEPETDYILDEDEEEGGENIDSEDPKVLKELIDLIKKVGGVEQLEKQLHLDSSSDTATTTTSPIHKKLYQNLLSRTRGKTFNSNIVSESQNSRPGPQNAGLEASSDKDKLLRKDRPQYTTINRSRPSTSTQEPIEEDIQENVEEETTPFSKAIVSQGSKTSATNKPIQYVNIRRGRPTLASTSDTADDTASRNALFERPESYVSVSESSPNSLDIAKARRDNQPEYVTIRRQRPTTEETTTMQYQTTEKEVETQATALEREISSPPQPQYTSIIRVRSTTLSPDEIETSELTTNLDAQVSSSEDTEPEADEDETEAPTTTSVITTTTTTTTTTTPAPSTTRRNILRRRGTTTTTTASPTSSTTKVSSRNYSFVPRRRPLPQRNEISLEPDVDEELTRNIRSTTPDSTEIDGTKAREIGSRRSRTRSQTTQRTQTEDSVPAATSPLSRGQFRPHLSRDEVISLTPIDVEAPQFVPRAVSSRSERRFRGRILSTTSNKVEDSDVSAATVEIRRPNIAPRGRNRFSPTSTTTNEQSVQQISQTESTLNALSQRRPVFSRFTPRPFSAAPIIDENLEEQEEVITARIPSRLPFARTRPTASPSTASQARKLPFPARISTTVQTIINEEDLSEEKHDDIALSESAIAELEHEDSVEQISETPKRRIIIKKLRAPTSTTESTISTEAVQITDDNGKKKFRVIRRRPISSTTQASEVSSVSTEAPTPQRIRKVIRKKVKPVEDEPEIIAKSIGSLKSIKESTTEIIANYGERSRPTLFTEPPTTAAAPVTERVSEDTNSKQETSKIENQEQEKKPEPEEDSNVHHLEVSNSETSKTESEELEKSIAEVIIETEQKSLDKSDSKTESPSIVTPGEKEVDQPETTTTSTTLLTSPAPVSRARAPYRPPKRLFTSTTETLPSSSRVFSRKYNPGAYTSPSTIEKASEAIRTLATRRPFASRTFTRKPFSTARTTKKVEEEEEEEEIEEPEYSEEEIEDESEEPKNSLVLVPPSQLFTRRPKPSDIESEEEESSVEEIPEAPIENRLSSRKPVFKPKIINSNTFRSTTSTTELPKRPLVPLSQNRTDIYNRFSAAKPVNDTKKRVQNVPIGYGGPSAGQPKENVSETSKETFENTPEYESITTTNASTDEITTVEDDDDYLSMTESSTTVMDSTETDTTITIDNNTDTATMEMDTDDYLEFTEGTTNYPGTQDATANTHTETNNDISEETIEPTTTEVQAKVTSTEQPLTTTTSISQVKPKVKTQYDKLFSVSRVVEVNSKLDKHRLNKKNETTLVEEGEIMVEKKPTVDKIGEVSRYSLIKIFEDEIPIYLTKLGHVYPVENPPDHIIHIDEARNARALVNFVDAPRENLIVSESMNEAYRHVNKGTNQPKDKVEAINQSEVVHVQNDQFLTYINDDRKNEKSDESAFSNQWQFIPAAYEDDRLKAAKSFEIVTPRGMQTEPSTLPLEGLFKTDNPTARKVVNHVKQPFVVYSSVPVQKEIAAVLVSKPEAVRNIITFAKGQEFNGASVTEDSTLKYQDTLAESNTNDTTEPSTTILADTPTYTRPIVELLTTTQSTISTTDTQTTVTTTEISTTETVPEETTTVKSLFDPKRSKFAFPKRPANRPNITRPAITPRIAKKNATVSGNLYQKSNKSSGNLNKGRFIGNRGQNVPVDVRKKVNLPVDGRKKINVTKSTPRSFTTETPRSTTERKFYVKPIRPNFRPSFIPRRSTTPSTQTEDT